MPLTLNYICHTILKMRPTSVLDIGVGFGKWGFLAREYADIWHQRLKKESWKTIIHGIEGFEQYVTPAARYVYDHIFIGDALEIIKTLKSYDLILCIAMLEHLTKEGGHQLLEWCGQNSELAFITLPIEPGNRVSTVTPFQNHRSRWTKSELSKFGKVSSVDGLQWFLEIR